MIHHERLRPPPHEYPADEWNIVEKGFHPEFLAQLETTLAVGNGYLPHQCGHHIRAAQMCAQNRHHRFCRGGCP
jgi:trehalose/maltose hydrolase-like predicted phosphorylase